MRPALRIGLLLLVAAVSATACPRTAHAGNDEGIPVGNDAALTGGAVGATVEDGNALHHNPAGIGWAASDQVDGSASLFVLRRFRIDDFIQPEGQPNEDAAVTALGSVPSSLSYSRRLRPGLSIALGVFVPQQESVEVRTSYLDPRRPVDLSLVYSLGYRHYRLAGGFGARVGDDFTFGASLVVDYQEASISSQSSGGLIRGLSDGAFLVQSSSAFFAGVGLEIDLGMQWRPHDRVSVGLSIRSPVFGVFTHLESNSVQGAASVGAATGVSLTTTNVKSNDFGFDLTAPLRARLAIALRFDRGWISIDGDVQHPLDIDERNVHLDWRWNARVGAMVELSDAVTFGVGGFTDRAADKAGGIDFYGGTVGIATRTARRLDTGAPITFTTTIGARYAYGRGDASAVVVNDTDDPAMILDTTQTDLRVHEIGLHLGSGINF